MAHPQILMKRQAVRELLENVALAWRAKFPAKARAYLDELRLTKDGLYGPSGMSKNGNLKFSASIPVDVFYVIDKKIPGFFLSAENMKLFQSIFMGCYAPEKTSGKFFYPGGPKK